MGSEAAFFITGRIHPAREAGGADWTGYKLRRSELEPAGAVLENKPSFLEHDYSQKPMGSVVRTWTAANGDLMGIIEVDLTSETGRETREGVMRGTLQGFSFGANAHQTQGTDGITRVDGIYLKEVSVVETPGVPGSNIHSYADVSANGAVTGTMVAVCASANAPTQKTSPPVYNSAPTESNIMSDLAVTPVVPAAVAVTTTPVVPPVAAPAAPAAVPVTPAAPTPAVPAASTDVRISMGEYEQMLLLKKRAEEEETAKQAAKAAEAAAKKEAIIKTLKRAAADLTAANVGDETLSKRLHQSIENVEKGATISTDEFADMMVAVSATNAAQATAIQEKQRLLDEANAANVRAEEERNKALKLYAAQKMEKSYGASGATQSFGATGASTTQATQATTGTAAPKLFQQAASARTGGGSGMVAVGATGGVAVAASTSVPFYGQFAVPAGEVANLSPLNHPAFDLFINKTLGANAPLIVDAIRLDQNGSLDFTDVMGKDLRMRVESVRKMR